MSLLLDNNLRNKFFTQLQKIRFLDGINEIFVSCTKDEYVAMNNVFKNEKKFRKWTLFPFDRSKSC